MFSFAKSASIVGGAVAGAGFTGKAIMDYETEIANLGALTGASGEDLDNLKKNIVSVAGEVHKSSVEVAQAFTAIANNRPELLKDADALSIVTAASIKLAQAARMEVAPAGEAVTQILNQYGASAKYATSLVDILAAGSVAGSSEIQDTSNAIQAFGTVAANAGVNILESVAMTELVSRFEKGTEAGTRLRNVLLEMSKGRAQDPTALGDLKRLHVNIDLVANKAVPITDRLHELKKIANDNTAILHVFGKENAALATGLLQSADNMKSYIDQVSAKGVVDEMAAKNTDTLRESLNQAAAKWTTIVTSSTGANLALDTVKGTVHMVTDHMEELISVALTAGSVFYGIKGTIWALRAATSAYNFALGVNTALQGEFATKAFATQAGMKGMISATWLMEQNMLALGTGVGAVVAVLGTLTVGFLNGYDATKNYTNELDRTKNGFIEIKKPIDEAKVAMEQYNQAAKDYNDLKKFEGNLGFFEKKGAVTGFFADLFNAYRHPLMYSQARMEMQTGHASDLLAPTKSDFFINAADTLHAEQLGRQDSLAQFSAAQLEPVNDTSHHYSEKKDTKEVVITVNDASKGGVNVSSGGVPVKVNSTFQFGQ
jgi:TP901 family phage tail tape measure protein